jgi:hypothetical protein
MDFDHPPLAALSPRGCGWSFNSMLARFHVSQKRPLKVFTHTQHTLAFKTTLLLSIPTLQDLISKPLLRGWVEANSPLAPW